MDNLGSDNDVEIKNGVQIMNGCWTIDCKLQYIQKYIFRDPENFVAWVTESFKSQDFKLNVICN